MKNIDLTKIKLIDPIPYYNWVWSEIRNLYPNYGENGLVLSTRIFDTEKYTNCLSYRNQEGELIGILEHFPTNNIPGQCKGNINLLVHPLHFGKGIGKRLLDEAVRIWNVNLQQQEYTPEGYALLERYLMAA